MQFQSAPNQSYAISSENISKGFVLKSHESIESHRQKSTHTNSKTQGGFIRKQQMSEIVGNHTHHPSELLGAGLHSQQNPSMSHFRRKTAKGSRDSCTSQVSNAGLKKGSQIGGQILPNRSRPGQQQVGNFTGAIRSNNFSPTLQHAKN